MTPPRTPPVPTMAGSSGAPEGRIAARGTGVGARIPPVDMDGETEQQPTPPLPTEIAVLAWASLAGQVVVLADRGVNQVNGVSLLGSMALGALLVGYVAAGVIRARPVRVALAWIVLVVSLVAECVGLGYLDGLREAIVALASLATTVVALVALYRFGRTPWYAWQRTRPPSRHGASIRGLVAIGVVVGVLGGVVGVPEDSDDGIDMTVRVAER